MQYTFDTHAFIKAFVNAKTEEEKAEILAKTISETREESINKIEQRLDKAKDELATKNDIKDLEVKMLKWMFGLFLAFSSAQLTLIVLILKFFFKGVGGV